MMKFQLQFPTPLHEQAASTAYQYFQSMAEVDTILVINSVARGQAIPESDLDMAVLVRPEISAEEAARLEVKGRQDLAATAELRRFRASGSHAHLHLDVVGGEFIPEMWDDGGGPDGFELGIGNLLAYAAPMRTAGPHYRQLQAQWLPYYGDDLRKQRLGMARRACAYDLEHVPFFVQRELYFQAFDRLYKAFQEFLQGLFIARRVYALAYNKWIRMQVEEWLGLPDLYQALPPLISVGNIESVEVVEKAGRLKELLDQWVIE